eukprot:2812889-Rhodomonas_salina.2
MDSEQADAQRGYGQEREKRRKTETGCDTETELEHGDGNAARRLGHGGTKLTSTWPRAPEMREEFGVKLDTQLKVSLINDVGLAFTFEVGDEIISVDSTPVHGMSVDEVAWRCAGEAGSQVEVTFSRNLTRRKSTPEGVSQRSSHSWEEIGLHQNSRKERSVEDEEEEQDALDETEVSDLLDLWERAEIDGRLTGDFEDTDFQVTDFLVSKGVDVASLQAKLRSVDNGMEMVEFGRWVREEQELRAKTAFLQQIDVHELLASKLPNGIRHNALAGLQRLSRTEAHMRCVAAAEELSQELWRRLEDLKQQQESTNDLLVEGNSKFAVQDQGVDLPEAKFVGIEDFQKGLQGLQGESVLCFGCCEEMTLVWVATGLPHHNILGAMELEHCSKADSKILFTTPNYNVTTTPEKEFELVKHREKAIAASEGSRRVLFFEDLLELEVVKRARLMVSEIIALQLYTGPMVASRPPVERYRAVCAVCLGMLWLCERGCYTNDNGLIYGRDHMLRVHGRRL